MYSVGGQTYSAVGGTNINFMHNGLCRYKAIKFILKLHVRMDA